MRGGFICRLFMAVDSTLVTVLRITSSVLLPTLSAILALRFAEWPRARKWINAGPLVVHAGLDFVAAATPSPVGC